MQLSLRTTHTPPLFACNALICNSHSMTPTVGLPLCNFHSAISTGTWTLNFTPRLPHAIPTQQLLLWDSHMQLPFCDFLSVTTSVYQNTKIDWTSKSRWYVTCWHVLWGTVLSESKEMSVFDFVFTKIGVWTIYILFLFQMHLQSMEHSLALSCLN